MAHGALGVQIGAMSFPNVGFEVWANTVAGNNAAAMIQPAGMWVRSIFNFLFVATIERLRT